MDDIEKLLNDVRNGDVSVEDAVLRLRQEPFIDIDYAKVDTHRKIRKGNSEVIYGEGKTSGQIKGIVTAMLENGNEKILITRLSSEKADALKDIQNFEYHEMARIGIVGDVSVEDAVGSILVITAGTSDIPVAEEAAVTAMFLGNRVTRVYDAGVAGIHRLLAHSDEIMKAKVIIVIAGMEGALASVVGGLASCPVIAVPTSVGYGAAFEGLTALLAMLNSCASGVSVVNIDNGFGAAYQASLINHI